MASEDFKIENGVLVKYQGNSVDVVIPDGIKKIENYAFSNCQSLNSITIPDSVTSIGREAFTFCNSLVKFNVNENNKKYRAIDGNLYSKDGSVLIKYAIGKSDKAFVVPNSVTSIRDNAFYSCRSLTSVTIPASVISIGNDAFHGCGSLESIILPVSVTSIGSWAFSWCTSLKSITIPDSVTRIGNDAFSCCESLTSVTIPDSITSIVDNAFFGCDSLRSITIPKSVTSIGNEAFYGCDSLRSITIPDGVTRIGDKAFYECSTLHNVSFGRGIKSIGRKAFLLCKKLNSVVLPEGFTNKFADSFGKKCVITYKKQEDMIAPTFAPEGRYLIEKYLGEPKEREFTEDVVYVTHRCRLMKMPREFYKAFKVGDCIVDKKFLAKYIGEMHNKWARGYYTKDAITVWEDKICDAVVADIDYYTESEGCLSKIYVDLTLKQKPWELYIEMDGDEISGFNYVNCPDLLLGRGNYYGWIKFSTVSGEATKKFNGMEALPAEWFEEDKSFIDYWCANHGYTNNAYLKDITLLEQKRRANHEDGEKATFMCNIKCDFEWDSDDSEGDYNGSLPKQCSEADERVSVPKKRQEVKQPATATVSKKPSAKRCSVLVKFENGKSYRYNCEMAVSVGDKVNVGGKLAGQEGTVTEIGAWEKNPYMQIVTEVLK